MDATSFSRSQKGDGNGRHSARSEKEPESLGMFSGRSPLGMEGASNRGGWGIGAATPLKLNQAAKFGGWREGCRRAWRAHCPAGREGGTAVSVTGAAALLNTRPSYVL